MGGRNHREIASIRQVSWNDTVARQMRRARYNNPTIDAGYYHELVDEGHAGLFGVFYGEEHVASFIVDIIEGSRGDEMYILQAVSDQPDANVFDIGLQLIEAMAYRINCASVAFGACREGTRHKAARMGYNMAEVVMRKPVEVNNGQQFQQQAE